MNLDALGWSPALAEAFAQELARDPSLVAGRVTRTERGTWFVETEQGTVLSRVPGRVHHRVADPLDLPAVGDWVALQPSSRPALIRAILPRHALLARKTIEDRAGEVQVIAANVDRVLIVEGLDKELRPRRLERMLAFARDSGAQPIVLLNKSDLAPAAGAAIEALRAVAGDATLLTLSALHGQGVADVQALLPPAQAAILVGASGAGKSTLANALLGEARQATTGVREGDAKGRHTTTHRELFVLPNGALLIDGPGMREFGLWLADEGVGETFPDIDALAAACRFSDCAHESEPGCAVNQAVEEGRLAPERLESYFKLMRNDAGRAARHDSRGVKKSSGAYDRGPPKKR